VAAVREIAEEIGAEEDEREQNGEGKLESRPTVALPRGAGEKRGDDKDVVQPGQHGERDENRTARNEGAMFDRDAAQECDERGERQSDEMRFRGIHAGKENGCCDNGIDD